VERLEILLVMRRERPKAFTAKVLRSSMAIAAAAAEHRSLDRSRGDRARSRPRAARRSHLEREGVVTLLAFLYGATALAALAVALFFFRFWRDTRDRLFLSFGIAFVVLAANRVALGAFAVAAENVPYLYLLRLVAFALIAFAIVDKNRSRP
jgi:hypothetical protein